MAKETKDIAASVRARLLNMARTSERDFDALLLQYMQERFLYALFTNKKQFQKELKKFMTGHTRRKALIQRLVKAGIWKGQ